MSNDKSRAGAKPAEPAPKPAQFETISTNAVNRAVALAMVHLEENLMSSRLLFERCKAVADAPQGDAQAALKTATRLLSNHSGAAEALARVARGESRHRTIVEYADGAKPEARLNSNFFGKPPAPERATRKTGEPSGKPKANGHAAE